MTLQMPQFCPAPTTVSMVSCRSSGPARSQGILMCGTRIMDHKELGGTRPWSESALSQHSSRGQYRLTLGNWLLNRTLVPQEPAQPPQPRAPNRPQPGPQAVSFLPGAMCGLSGSEAVTPHSFSGTLHQMSIPSQREGPPHSTVPSGSRNTAPPSDSFSALTPSHPTALSTLVLQGTILRPGDRLAPFVLRCPNTHILPTATLLLTDTMSSPFLSLRSWNPAQAR